MLVDPLQRKILFIWVKQIKRRAEAAASKSADVKFVCDICSVAGLFDRTSVLFEFALKTRG